MPDFFFLGFSFLGLLYLSCLKTQGGYVKPLENQDTSSSLVPYVLIEARYS